MTTAVPAEAQLERSVVPAGVLLPCCVVESQDAAGAFLALKNTATGELLRVTTPSTRYRVGQAVDMNSKATALAITPFPAEYDKRSTIHGDSTWKMHTWISVSKEGVIDGKTLITSSNPTLGFTGGVEVLLLDRSLNLLHQTSLRTYGVQLNSSRTINWHETAPLAAANKVRAVVIHHSYDPKVRLAAGLEWLNDNAGDVSEVLTCIRQKAGAAIQCSGQDAR
jgi:hypothetical protein